MESQPHLMPAAAVGDSLWGGSCEGKIILLQNDLSMHDCPAQFAWCLLIGFAGICSKGARIDSAHILVVCRLIFSAPMLMHVPVSRNGRALFLQCLHS